MRAKQNHLHNWSSNLWTLKPNLLSNLKCTNHINLQSDYIVQELVECIMGLRFHVWTQTLSTSCNTANSLCHKQNEPTFFFWSCCTPNGHPDVNYYITCCKIVIVIAELQFSQTATALSRQTWQGVSWLSNGPEAKKKTTWSGNKHKYTTTTREICHACSPTKVYLCLHIIEGMEKESREQLNGSSCV